MSIRPRSYRFSTAAQWQSGLFYLASPQSGQGLQPLRPFARNPELAPSAGGSAPTALLTRQILWRDDARILHWLSATGGVASFTAPRGLATSPRLIANSYGLWAIGEAPESLLCFEPETLTRLAAVDLPDARVVDLTAVSCDLVGVLVETKTGWSIVSVGRGGNVPGSTPLTGIHRAVACTFLRHSQLLVVLSGDSHPSLHWFSVDGGAPKFSIPVSLLFPCCQCHGLASGADDRIYVAASSGGRHEVLVLDPDGTLIDTVPVSPADGPVTGIAATTGNLYVAGPRGLLRYAIADTVPIDAAEVRCTFVTPVLESPDPEGTTPWLRADVSASLPEGCGVEISVASTDAVDLRDRLAAIAADTKLSPGRRIQRIMDEPDLWQPRTSFHDSGTSGALATLAAPLFDLPGRFLWVAVTLTAPPGSAFPAVGELKVLYPGHGLMENLPAIYNYSKLGATRNEARPDGFARYLVGVLEATTQGLDASISSLGSHIQPGTAPEEWLNYIARWLGLPWDDALSLAQKRTLMRRAPELARTRGTRAGLEMLLQCLFPGTPRRFRIADGTADFGFVVLGCDSAPGTALPALLGGFSRGRAELGPGSVLGVMRLPCPDQPDDPTSRLIGNVRVDIAASASERKAWEPWIASVLSAMAPATVTLTLRWIPQYALKSSILDGTLVLEAAPVPHLGADAITGLARLPETKPCLSQTGLTIGALLR